ncbi:MAG: HAD family hydrolase [Acidimicrobiales bacterium]
MTSPRLIVFDCDGVLVDSEVLVIEVEAAMLTEAGYMITADEIAERFVGLSYATMMRELAADFGRPVPDDLNRRIQDAALARFPDLLRPVAGIEDVMSVVPQDRCVASSSDLDRIELSLTLCGLDHHFGPDRIFSAQMVANGKPAPDLFLLAAERMGAEPADCLVIEDSPAGVTAATAAGMVVLGLVAGGHARPALAHRLRQAGAQHVFATTGQLGDHLATLA